ncbi:low molecular weight phosphotyrosine protein phosphatase, partial [Streptococcus suis]
MYSGTQKIFKKHKIPYDKTKNSQQISQAHFEEFDVIIVMYSNNVR